MNWSHTHMWWIKISYPMKSKFSQNQASQPRAPLPGRTVSITLKTSKYCGWVRWSTSGVPGIHLKGPAHGLIQTPSKLQGQNLIVKHWDCKRSFLSDKCTIRSLVNFLSPPLIKPASQHHFWVSINLAITFCHYPDDFLKPEPPNL